MNRPDVWALYQKGRAHHEAAGLYKACEQYHDFYEGEQWRGLISGGERMPVLNFIKPVGRYKVAMIAQNKVAVVYSPLRGGDAARQACEALSAYASALWEHSKMDSLVWKVVKNAFIAGDHYLYCFDARTGGEQSVARDLSPQLRMRSIHKTQVYLADEQNPELQEQEWIILAERVPVSVVRERARRAGVSEREIERITPDEDTAPYIGEEKQHEVESGEGKCTSILFLRKTPQGLEYCRATERVVYEPMRLLPGLFCYPLVGMRWEDKVGSARGVSGVAQMIANQIEVNKTAARRVLAIKRFSYPKLAYDTESVANPEALEQIGAAIGVQNLRGVPLSSLIQYLNPAPVSSDAAALQSELITVTRELEGASSAVTGQIDPTHASGEAIKAARDQAAVPLNEQMAAYHQFLEDVALLWWRMFCAYGGGGVEVSFERDGQPVRLTLPAQALGGEVNIRVDISPVDPYSRVSQEIALERLLAAQHITFAEYVESLSDSSSVPKARLTAILERRAAMRGAAGAAPAGGAPAGAAPAGMDGDSRTASPMQRGGEEDALPNLPVGGVY